MNWRRPGDLVVNFSNVGREKKAWTVTIPTYILDDEAVDLIAAEARRNGGLMSRGVYAVVNPDTGKGFLVAGVRRVGEFAITRAEETAMTNDRLPLPPLPWPMPRKGDA